ncbi:TIGR03826 family flagellar region protein [Aquibacillus rhizosphaerae]|uniref:Flagellar protein n=1 Tax=Aquibacillus rhizosphaerae TaxID=3051431 RepID=A0ABT7L3N8_9BACI|nr:TIGR03826 family flagellar region protein [Aquibacillus sp. LR5S19]MDL4839215.1 hypothetical protein [Aquibacillus sp. LR5S19]
MGELANCPRCDALFVKGLRDICQDCFKKEELAFQTVYDYMKKRANRTATVMQIVEETEVEEDLIIKFVKEKRLRASQFPNLHYPCEKCGNPIIEGKLCGPCSKGLVTELNKQGEIDKVSQRNKAEDKQKANTYYSVKKDRQ